MRNGQTPHLRSIEQLAREIRGGVSPVEVLDEYLHRIGQHNGTIRALIHVDGEQARARAIVADSEIRSGRYRGPLHGVPIAVKDAIDVAGWPTTGGSKLFGDRLAEADATCVANLRAAGAIIIGKANMHEITAGNHDNPWYGKVVNPFDSNRGTGGTSSGSAAAVAAGFCAASLGTDTGGSNRSVAAATGLVGYKPSYGLISQAGILPTATSFDTTGPITLTVADARLMMLAMQGRPTDELQTPSPALPPADLRIVTCPDLYSDQVDQAARDGIDRWTTALTTFGVCFVEKPFVDAEKLAAAGLAILQYEFAAEYGPLIDAHPERVAVSVHDFLTASRQIQQSDYLNAQEARAQLRGAFFSLLDGADALMVPTAPGLAPRLSDEQTKVTDHYVPYGRAGGRFRRWANVFGMPAIALPLATDGVFGASVQIAALPGQDSDVFQIASRLPIRSLMTH